MGVEIMLTLYVALLSVGMDVLQLPRNDLTEPLSHILLRRGDRVHARVGLRREAHHDDRIGKRDARLGKTDLHRDIHTGLDDRDDLGIGKSDVLTRADNQSAARGDQIVGFDQTREIEQRRVDVRAAHTLLVGGDHVVVSVAVAVITRAGSLGQGLR